MVSGEWIPFASSYSLSGLEKNLAPSTVRPASQYGDFALAQAYGAQFPHERSYKNWAAHLGVVPYR